MSTIQEEPTLHELATGLAELERADARVQAELTQERAARAPAAEKQTSTQTPIRRSNRRKVLEKGLGVAVATVGAGALLELSSGTASAAPTPKPGVFASSTAGTPAVKATGTNGADGVDATSDSGTGVSATSGSGTGLLATSSSGLAGHFVGNVKLDNALMVTGTLSSGAGTFASSVAATPSITATGTNGAHGVDASSDSGIAVSATSSFVGVLGQSLSGFGVKGTSSSGDGVNGMSSSGNGVKGTSSSGPGINGMSTSGPGVGGGSSSGIGVGGSSITGIGVSGVSNSLIGVFGNSPSGTGVKGSSISGTGLVATSSTGLAGLFNGNVSMSNNLAVAGTLSSGAGTFASSVVTTPSIKATGTNGADGVDATSDSGTAVSATSTSGDGVRGVSTSGVGVFGDSSFVGVFGLSSSGNGVHGVSSTGLAGFFSGNVLVNGNVTVNGILSATTKNFVQDHPTDPTREIVYVSLEGGEAGTYVRGTGHLVNGKAVIELPEHFGLVTATEGLTVHLTPRGEWLQLYLVELDPAQIVVREAQGKSGAFDYLVHGVRLGYEQHEVIRTKR